MADINYPIANKQEVDEQLAEKVQNFKIKNEVVNGDFSQGTTGWIGIGGLLSVLNNTMQSTGNGWNPSISIREDRVYTILQNGRKEYARVRMRVRDNQAQYIRMRLYAGHSDTTINSPIQDQWYEASAIMTGNPTTEAAPYIRFQPNSSYADSATANGKVFEIEKPLIIKLTDVFGAGNEPTKEEMDRLVSIVPNQWWDGELDLTQQQYVNWLLSFIREKANKQQEAWITPTLLNGWVVLTDSYPVSYMKDNFGFVHIRGVVSGGSLGTVIFSLPNGYKPENDMYLPAYSNNTVSRLKIYKISGSLIVDIGSAVWVSLDGISFKGV